MSKAAAHSLNEARAIVSPGGPRRIFEIRSWGTLLWALVLVAFVFAAQAVAADYLIRIGKPIENRGWLLHVPWLDARAAITALVAMLGLAIARHNLALGLRPYLSYANIAPKADDKPPKFVVLIRNEGTGPAVIADMRYELRFEGDDFESILEHETVVNRIKERCGLVEGLEYKLHKFSVGATIGKDKERIMLEVNNDAIDRLLAVRHFLIKVRYKGLLGDLYEKTVECLRPDDYRRPRSLPPTN
ncbi:MAG TPA: hypothetical protein VJ783_23920 [Pirellulales bacterium]|nr:hypothetical protein [Pirellulales bacterium]